MVVGGFTVDKRCKKSPRIAPRDPGKANTPFQVGNGRSISLMAGGFWVILLLAKYFANSNIFRVCDAKSEFLTPKLTNFDSARFNIHPSIHITVEFNLHGNFNMNTTRIWQRETKVLIIMLNIKTHFLT
jgi:hypothetical protein